MSEFVAQHIFLNIPEFKFLKLRDKGFLNSLNGHLEVTNSGSRSAPISPPYCWIQCWPSLSNTFGITLYRIDLFVHFLSASVACRTDTPASPHIRGRILSATPCLQDRPQENKQPLVLNLKLKLSKWKCFSLFGWLQEDVSKSWPLWGQLSHAPEIWSRVRTFTRHDHKRAVAK